MDTRTNVIVTIKDLLIFLDKDPGNAALSKTRVVGLDLSNMDLSHRPFAVMHLEKVNFRNANLVGADCGGVHMDDVDLSGANLTDADLSDAKMHRVDMTGACLRNGRINNSWMNHVNLQGIDITDVIAVKANIKDCNMDALVAKRTRISRAWIERCSLQRACFDGANVRYTVFNDADLSDASFASADLTGARFNRVDLRRSNFVGCAAEGAKFRDRIAVYGARGLPLGTAEKIEDLDFSEAGDGSDIRPEFNR